MDTKGVVTHLVRTVDHVRHKPLHGKLHIKTATLYTQPDIHPTSNLQAKDNLNESVNN